MGTWGVKTFDNDVASDWALDLEDSRDLSVVQAALKAVLSCGNDYLDGDVACEGLAACEVIARLQGRWGPRDAYTRAIDEWVQLHPQAPPAALLREALLVVDRVLRAPSELLDVWRDSPDLGAWQRSVSELRARLAG